ncbi:MAG: DUF4157 domain-containing protein [Pirellulaceae bacterium]
MRPRYTFLVVLCTMLAPVVAQAQVHIIQEFTPSVSINTPNPSNVLEKVQGLDDDLTNKWDRWKDLLLEGATREQFAQLGSVMYVAISRTMKERSPKGEAISRSLKNRLAKHFEEQIDHVNLHWGVELPDEYAANRIKISITGTESEAQTYGYDIYLRWKKEELTEEAAFYLLAHELEHVRQFESNDKSLAKFGYEYFKKLYDARFDYESNEYEVAARRAATNASFDAFIHLKNNDFDPGTDRLFAARGNRVYWQARNQLRSGTIDADGNLHIDLKFNDFDRRDRLFAVDGNSFYWQYRNTLRRGRLRGGELEIDLVVTRIPLRRLFTI